MDQHVSWSRSDNAASRWPRLECESQAPATMLLLTRLAFLMGGRAAEDNLAIFATDEPVERLLEEPRHASGDLRQAQKLVRLNHLTDEAAALGAAYWFAQRVLTARWADVQLLAGAVVVKGTLDGRELESLLQWSSDAAPCTFLRGCAWAAGTILGCT